MSTIAIVMVALDEVAHAMQSAEVLEANDELEALRAITAAHNHVSTAREILAQRFEVCHQEGCKGVAHWSFVWPGKPRDIICQSHFEKLLAVADGLGLERDSLDLRRLER